jgi:pimeloyl-ACP methyl ester carboxylesterase
MRQVDTIEIDIDIDKLTNSLELERLFVFALLGAKGCFFKKRSGLTIFLNSTMSFSNSYPLIAAASVCCCGVAAAAMIAWRRSSVSQVLVQARDLSPTIKSRFVRLSAAHNNASVHCFVGGAAKPSVTVLLIHGFGCNTLEFAPVMLALAEQNCTVVAADRVLFVPQVDGVSTRDRSCDVICDELRDLLDQLVASGDVDATLPLVLVGHSYGGLIAQHFAMRHGGTAGLVLVDPAHEDQFRVLPSDFTFGFAMTPIVFACLSATAPLGVPRFFRRWLPFPPIHLYPSSEREIAELAYTEADGLVWRRISDELAGCRVGMEQTRALRLQRRLPQNVTILVATARSPSPTFFPQRVTDAFLKLARPLAQPSSALILANRSNHWIHVEEPDLVIDAITAMIKKAREAC